MKVSKVQIQNGCDVFCSWHFDGRYLTGAAGETRRECIKISQGCMFKLIKNAIQISKPNKIFSKGL
jgi:hypothetical protein